MESSNELREIIAQGEGENLDFKFEIDDQKKIARTLVAFANTSGGKLLIGVKDNGKISGIHPEEEFHMIEGASELHTQPKVPFLSRVWKEKHHLVLEIEVKKSKEKHKAKDENGKWKFYTRINDNTLLANKILTRIWRLEERGVRRPEKFNEETLQFLSIIRENAPVSISKLHKLSSLKMNKVDSILSVLVFWDVVEMHIGKEKTVYTVA